MTRPRSQFLWDSDQCATLTCIDKITRMMVMGRLELGFIWRNVEGGAPEGCLSSSPPLFTPLHPPPEMRNGT